VEIWRWILAVYKERMGPVRRQFLLEKYKKKEEEAVD
jgi:hypothetical protein